jgi:ribA/ribD-fused uncharacterized protein
MVYGNYMDTSIREFKGEFHFLSNFYPSTLVWAGVTWPCAECAYQAAKTNDEAEFARFAAMTAGQSKRAGKAVTLRPDWEEVKYDIMREIVVAKFLQNPDIAAQLIATGDAWLEEGNWWGDRIWGVSPAGSGRGLNWLGEILMDVRSILRSRV